MLEAKNITKNYDVGVTIEVLRGVSFSINRGEFVSIMGPSGSGKSTLLHIMSFLDRPTSGIYRFNGKSIAELSDTTLARIRNKEMGFVFQAFFLLPRTSVLENVMLPLQYNPQRVGRKRMMEMARTALDRVGLSHRLEHSSAALSGGERQRVAIARALINNPAVIFADEPTGNLDSAASAAVMAIFEKLHSDGHTIVLVTHELDIAKTADRLITIKDGLIAQDKRL